MKLPLVSIIISVYNSGQSLTRMVESIRAQTCADWELILVNDGSTDDGFTGSIIAALQNNDSRIRSIEIPNSGCMAARFVGVKLARGQYIYLCDQDDYLHPELLAYCVWALSHHNADLLMFKHEPHFLDSDPGTHQLQDYDSYPLRKVELTDPLTDVDAFRSYTTQARLDVWELFSTRELYQSIPPPIAYDDTNVVFNLLCRAHRGLASDLKLYFYFRNVENSMINSPLSLKKVRHMYEQALSTYHVFSDLIRTKDPDYDWMYIARSRIARSIKRKLKPLKQTSKLIASSDYATLCTAFVHAVEALEKDHMFRTSDLSFSARLRLLGLRLQTRLFHASKLGVKQ